MIEFGLPDTNQPSFIEMPVTTVDSKGRLVIPNHLRTMIKTDWPDEQMKLICHPWFFLILMPVSLYEEKVSEILKLPEYDESAMVFKGALIGMAENASLDKLGRIVVSSVNRSFAGIKSKVMVLNMVKNIRLFAENIWLDRVDKEGKKEKRDKPRGWENFKI